MEESKDLTGVVFGSLTAVEIAPRYEWKSARHPEWRCLCNCGATLNVIKSSLVSGKTRSCGCLRLKRDAGRLLGLVGQRAGRLTIQSFIPAMKRDGGSKWICVCDCGTTVEIPVGRLAVNGRGTKSCGCLNRDVMLKTAKTRVKTHGRSYTKTYKAWVSMKGRCNNPKAGSYKHYGGRGISVCSKWMESFEAFLADMGECPDNYSLDRINVEGNYEPANCRWADRITQANNTRRNKK